MVSVIRNHLPKHFLSLSRSRRFYCDAAGRQKWDGLAGSKAEIVRRWDNEELQQGWFDDLSMKWSVLCSIPPGQGEFLAQTERTSRQIYLSKNTCHSISKDNKLLVV